MAGPQVGDASVRDCEARVRALTREVGSLREDLRRECKRRERAVALASERDEQCQAAQAAQKELEYANRKLAAQLDSAYEGARASAQRDRHALAQLREGLTLVEQEVVARGRQGAELAQEAGMQVAALKALLLRLPGSTVLGASLAQQVGARLAAAERPLSQLLGLLRGSSVPPGDHEPGQPADTAQAAAMAVIADSAASLEVAHLRDEVARLQSQLAAVVDNAAGAANAAMLDIQTQLQDSQSEALALRAELVRLQAEAEAARQAVEAGRAEAAAHAARAAAAEAAQRDAELRVTQLMSDKQAAELQVAAMESGYAQLAELQQSLAVENSTLRAEAARTAAELQATTTRLEALQANIVDQQADVAAAMQLVMAGEAARAPLRPIPPPQARSPMANAAAAHHLLKSQLPLPAQFKPPAAHTTVRFTARPAVPATPCSPQQQRMQLWGPNAWQRSSVHMPTFHHGVSASPPRRPMSAASPRPLVAAPATAAAVQRAAENAAAAAAAAIAARLKAQRAVATAAAASTSTAPVDDTDGVSTAGADTARAQAFKRLGAAIQLAPKLPRELPLSPAASSRSSSSNSSSSSSTSSAGNSVSGAVPQEPAPASGSGPPRLDKLLHDMRGLDEQIAVLEASMRASAMPAT